MNTDVIFYSIIAIYAFSYFWNLTLEWLNLMQSKKKYPPELDGIFSEEEEEKAKLYFRESTLFSMIQTDTMFWITFILLYFGFFGFLSIYSSEITHHPLAAALVFFGILFFASDLLNIPFDLYDQFKIEEKFGFNKMTLKLYFTDKIKSYLLTVLIGGAILFALLNLIFHFKEDFWLLFLIFIIIVSVGTNLFYTSWILPLFNKLEPLSEGILKNKIIDYSKKAGFELENIYVMDGSKRSSKANAFFSGFGKRKKIVLFDTLLEKLSNEEIVVVLAHEVGHYKKRHIVSGLLMSIFYSAIMLFILSKFLFNEQISLALGEEKLSIHLNLLGFGILYAPISMLLGLISTIISRKNEFEADKFAADTYSAEHLISALKKLSISNLSNLNPHLLYVFFNYSHPTLLQRIEKLKK